MSALTPDVLVGQNVLDVTVAWHIYDGVRSPTPDPVWLNMSGLGQVRCGCAGRGNVNLALSTPVSFDMDQYGVIEVESWDNSEIRSFVGAEVESAKLLVYMPHDIEVGFVLRTTQGCLGVANLADELRVGPWPSEHWDGEEIAERE
ncbi:MAG: hypothetical protein JWO62_312 [Acidimicrobiaceae bacterium]|jgi:hypothetical protein|nr:hypothetical protein [Acidimicrobiaceae bacterium]